jgi:hypothetical protein
LTSPRRLTLAYEIEEHKQVHGEETKSLKEFDSTHEWGSKTEERRPVLDGNELRKNPTSPGG